MLRKKFLTFLFLEVATTLLVILIFRYTPSRNVAGVMAGSLFISVGAYIVFNLKAKSARFKTFTFPAALVHLFVTAIPLLTVRLMNWGTPHAELSVWGLPAPTFHMLAEKIFLILMLCTVFDFLKTYLPKKHS